MNIPKKKIDPKRREEYIKKENLSKFKNILLNDKVELFIVPSILLKEIILKGEDPLILGLPDKIKSIILEGHGIAIEKSMIIKWLEGKLDTKNSFILDNSEIRVIEDQSIKLYDPKKDNKIIN
jgi:hypothetical protein